MSAESPPHIRLRSVSYTHLTLPTRFLTGTAAAGGIALINTVASLGGFVGPYIIGLVRKLTGGFAGGLVFLAVLMLIGAAAALLLRNAPVLADRET